MKNKKWIFIIAILIICLILLHVFSFKKITYREDRSMLFIVMPSPPQAKIITDSDEIVSIIDLLNHSNKVGSGVVIGMQSWIGQIRNQ